jgi:hypothetical protein
MAGLTEHEADNSKFARRAPGEVAALLHFARGYGEATRRGSRQ